MFAGQLAFLAAAVFARAAVYITALEQPARLGLDARSLLTQWTPAYARGAAMQAPLAIVGFLLGLVAWGETDHVGWVCRCPSDDCELARDLLRHHADEQSPDADGSCSGRPKHPGHDRKVGLPPCDPDRARVCRRTCIPVGLRAVTRGRQARASLVRLGRPGGFMWSVGHSEALLRCRASAATMRGRDHVCSEVVRYRTVAFVSERR
jgi:hypothetical protein